MSFCCALAWSAQGLEVLDHHGDAAELDSASANSIEPGDEFDVLIHERLHTDDSGKDTVSREVSVTYLPLHEQNALSTTLFRATERNAAVKIKLEITA